MQLTAHPYRVPRLRMSGAIPLTPRYAFMAWIRKAVHIFTVLFRRHEPEPGNPVDSTDHSVADVCGRFVGVIWRLRQNKLGSF